MDLGTIMKKIDDHYYNIPKQWIADIELISRNALEYAFYIYICTCHYKEYGRPLDIWGAIRHLGLP